MKRWDRFHWQPTPAKRPPPEHGIKLKRAGSTWWGRRWIEALERMSEGYSNRLSRGKTYARAGRTHDLVVQPGEVSALVTGSRTRPYQVQIGLAKLKDATWRKAIQAMARKAQFTAELLAGQMPSEIDDAFREAGSSLFPVKPADLRTSCTCPDWANPCKHVAATHYVLGEAFDGDPFLLFELRGRTKGQVLEALRAARSGGRAARRTRSLPEKKRDAGPDVPRVSFARMTAVDYEHLPQPLPVLHLTLQRPATRGALLGQLGAPAGWTLGSSPAALLAPVVHAASEHALRLALAEPEKAGASQELAVDPPNEARKQRAARRPRSPRAS